MRPVGEDWVARELAEQTADRPLRGLIPRILFHATRGIAEIESDRAIRSLAEIRLDRGNAAVGFGHAGVVSGAQHVSLTTSEPRARAYFDVLVALAAIAEQKVEVERWFEWYLARWGPPNDLLQGTATRFDLEVPGALADAFGRIHVETAWRPPSDIRRDALAALAGLDVAQRLAWLFAVDEVLMQIESPDRGLGIVQADVGSWSRIRLSDVALLRVQLPDTAMGYLHEDEEEVRVRGAVRDFEVIERGETRFVAFTW